MQAISAVLTTGIYCRPGCSANPKPGNVTTFTSAAAAEAAGYRACLRCRPYRSQQTFPGAAPELVCRAVQMILDGALDDGTEQCLAGRLGVSGRHLRRLFSTHLGVTPDQLARSSRAHFARRLLDDTDLTITDIAFAAGFGSVRQLNRACQVIFRASPRRLRARRRISDRLVADGGLTLRLPFAGELDWPSILNYLAARAVRGVECVTDNTYRRTIVVGGDPGVLEITRGSADHLLLKAHLPHWAGLIHLVARARRIFSLDAPTDEAVGHLQRDPVVGDMVTSRPGLRVPGTWDPYETALQVIIGQDHGVAEAAAITALLVDTLGAPVPGLHQLGLSHTFPTPAQTASADLTRLGLPPATGEAVHSFARTVATGSLRLDRSATLEELTASITALPGLRAGTAHHIALRLGERDAFPATDPQLQTTLNRTCPGGGRSPEELAEQWRPWRATAAIQLLHPPT